MSMLAVERMTTLGGRRRLDREDQGQHGDAGQRRGAPAADRKRPAHRAADERHRSAERRREEDADQSFERDRDQHQRAERSRGEDEQLVSAAVDQAVAIGEISGGQAHRERREHEQAPAIGAEGECRNRHPEQDQRHPGQHALDDRERIGVSLRRCGAFVLGRDWNRGQSEERDDLHDRHHHEWNQRIALARGGCPAEGEHREQRGRAQIGDEGQRGDPGREVGNLREACQRQQPEFGAEIQPVPEGGARDRQDGVLGEEGSRCRDGIS